MKVVEIFESIDGEGIRVGLPVTFIRLYGCNLKCSYCDSQYACCGGDYKEMSIDEILNEVADLGHNRITLTGGEPLIHPDVKYLLRALWDKKYEVNIETNGAVDIRNIPRRAKTIITLDYKCPSSGMEDKMLLSNLNLLRKTDVLKFVVGSIEDLNKAKDILSEYDLYHRCNIYFSPVFGNIEPKEIVEFLLRNKLETVRIQLQLHKFIWEPDKRGV